MANGVRFEIVGVKELERALAQLPKSVSKGVLRSALKTAGQPVVAAAKANCPRDRGDLAESITIRSTLSRRQRRRRRVRQRFAAEMFIGPSWPQGAHGHLVEFGTSKMPARPFLRPAWDANKRRALDTIGKEIWRAIAKAARRLAKRAEAGKLSAKQARELL